MAAFGECAQLPMALGHAVMLAANIRLFASLPPRNSGAACAFTAISSACELLKIIISVKAKKRVGSSLLERALSALSSVNLSPYLDQLILAGIIGVTQKLGMVFGNGNDSYYLGVGVEGGSDIAVSALLATCWLARLMSLRILAHSSIAGALGGLPLVTAIVLGAAEADFRSARGR